ncbi:MAG: tetratricopeptide repeat protein, partial [Candidatus Lokiarchaeota archaeon]|nr:tetratricopeptide repeat protein [Candidatus Lokiarchaeota archaeon]
LEFYNKALIIDNKIGNIYGIARDMNNIGLVFKRQGKKKEALIKLRNSLKILQENNLNQLTLTKKIEENIKAIERDFEI